MHTQEVTWNLESVGRSVLDAAADAGAGLSDLADEIAHLVGHVLPHDGFWLMGLDPVAGTPAFAARRHGYSPYACFRLETSHRADHDLNPFAALVDGPRPARVFGTGSPMNEVTAPLHELMAEEGVADELRVALTLRGRAWGGLTLLRGPGRRPFTTEDADCAAGLGPYLAAALRKFVSGRGQLGGAHGGGLGPGTLLIDDCNWITSATPDARSWLRHLATDPLHADGGRTVTPLWGPLTAARRGDPRTTTCVPTAQGWIAVSAQPLDGPLSGHVAATIQPAPADALLTAMSTWYGITPRELAVVQCALEGGRVKQIARLLQLSHHTVNDHFGAVYRKVGVSGRDELIRLLTR
ncbi:helix-turn-helix transcriptional regulator [Streptomyces lasiicapitis]|uniref:helix-turn-helix transcriptional regulator n=1 Tax=Streptomyces lasiicapitis TaxID=1923961 RepID=UPI00332D57FD